MVLEAYFESSQRTLRIDDDSMSPLIPTNSVVSYFDGIPNNNDDIVLVKLEDGTHVVRRYIFTGEKVVLIADNRNYPPIIMNSDEITIVGRVLSYSISV